MTGLRPLYDRCFGTSIDNSAWPVSVNAERVTLAWKYVSISSLSVLSTDIPDIYNDDYDPPVIVAPVNVQMSYFSFTPHDYVRILVRNSRTESFGLCAAVNMERKCFQIGLMRIESELPVIRGSAV